MARVPAQQRRQELIDAAFTVMARDGVAAASTRAITAQANAPLSAFHYCFRSKQELLQELTTTVVNELVREAREVLRPGANLRDGLRDGLRRLWETAARHPDQQLVLYELTCLSLRDPALAGLGKWQYECYFTEAARYLEDVAAAAGTKWRLPMPVVSRMFITCIDGVCLGWLADRNDAQVLEALDGFADQLATFAEPASTSAALPG